MQFQKFLHIALLHFFPIFTVTATQTHHFKMAIFYVHLVSLLPLHRPKTFHHRRTAVRPVLMATTQFNGNGQTLTPHRIQTP